jgi:hypothetical protein
MLFEPFHKLNYEFQRLGKDRFDAAVRSYGEANKGLQTVAAKVTDYSKKSFEDAARAFEQLVDAKSLEQVIEIQSNYAKKALDAISMGCRSSLRFISASPAMHTSRSSKQATSKLV